MPSNLVSSQASDPSMGSSPATRELDETRVNSLVAVSRAAHKRLKRIQNKLAVIAVVFAIGANIASVPGHIETVRLYLFKSFGIQNTQLWHLCLSIIIGMILLISYIFLAFWLYTKRMSKYRERTGLYYGGQTLALVVALSLSGINIEFAIPRPPPIGPIVQRAQARMADAIIAQQDNRQTDEDSGGFQFAQNGGSHDVQVWTTAQALYALELAKPRLPQLRMIARNAIQYIERTRVPSSKNTPCQLANGQQDGWAYIKPLSWGVTEINSWVLLAEMASLRPAEAPAIWDGAEIPIAVSRIKRDLDALVDRQHDTGGWAPIAKTNDDNHLRTYSTLMALWTLTEAKRNFYVTQVIGHDYDRAVANGFHWIMNKWWFDDDHKGPSGLWPNPSWKEPVYLGLTAQAIYVLELVAKDKDQQKLADDPTFRKTKSQFIEWGVGATDKTQSILSIDVADNQRLHDSDRYLEHEPYTVEQMTFLWYPWVLMALKELNDDQELPEEVDRKVVIHLFNSVLEKINFYSSFAKQDPVIYPYAEGLLALDIAK